MEGGTDPITLANRVCKLFLIVIVVLSIVLRILFRAIGINRHCCSHCGLASVVCIHRLTVRR